MKPFRPIDIFRLGIVSVIVGVIFLSLSFYPTYSFLPNWSYWDTTIPINADSSRKVEVGFIPRNNVFVGKITVYSEYPKVTLKIMDSLGERVFPSISVDGTYSFVFRAPKNDFYYFHFDNTEDTLDDSSYRYDKAVLWQIYYYVDYDFIFLVSGSLSLISGLVCIAFYLSKPRTEKMSVVIPPETYELLQKRAISKNKSIEEIVEEIVAEFEEGEPSSS